MLRKQRKRRKLLIMAGILMSLAAGAKPGNMTAFAAETAVTAQQTQTAQSDRWEGTGNTWKLRKADNSGYVTNSWFQDLDGSWYMLGSTGEMYAGLITDQSTGKSYLLNTEHDGTYGRMLTKDGVYNVNGQQIYLTFNQSHDGTYGAILTGLSEIRTSGVQETELPSIPTDSDTGSSKSGGGQSSSNDATDDESVTTSSTGNNQSGSSNTTPSVTDTNSVADNNNSSGNSTDGTGDSYGSWSIWDDPNAKEVTPGSGGGTGDNVNNSTLH